MHDPSKTRIHHRGEGSYPVPVIAPQFHGHQPAPVPVVEQPEPNFSMVERVALLLTCILTSSASIVFIYVVVKAVQVLREVAEIMKSVPGLGN